MIEHILEKFSLLFPQDNQTEYLRNMLLRVNEKMLFLFNNVFVRQYIDQLIYPTNIDILNYQKITKEKFLTVVRLMENVFPTKQLLDQLSDASLSV